ncbi:hypothetical protein [Luteolibacter soli]|uniref:DUF3592 domain-containing protein n=1 Tax=Luteolibacter soli TaxID=3135280 RepID=A0ABU9AVF6_9BACT
MHWKIRFRYGQKSVCHAGSGICVADLGRLLSESPSWSRGEVSPDDARWREVRFDGPEVLRVSGDSRQVHDYYVVSKGERVSKARNAAAVHFNEALFFPVAGAWAIYIPHWVVMVCFAVVWSVFLAWRWRREKRLNR